MRPTPANEALSAWLDGELDEAGISEIEAELARDPVLREDLRMLEEVVRQMRDEPPPIAPEGFERAVMARIAEEFPDSSDSWASFLRRPFGIPLEGWLLGLAAAAVLVTFLPVWRVVPPSDPGAQKGVSPAAIELPTAPDEALSKEDLVSKSAPAPEIMGKASVGEPEQSPPVRKGGPISTGTRDVASTRGTAEVDGAKTKEEPPEPVPPVPAPSEGLTLPSSELPQANGTGDETLELGPEPYQMVVSSASPSLKRDLLAVVSRYGQSRTTSGMPVRSAKMSGTETLVVTLPQTDLLALAADLRAMGHQVELHSSDAMAGGSEIELRVTLRLEGDADTSTKSKPVPRPVGTEPEKKLSPSAD